ncbi:alpha-xylosidase [Ruania halotolerans]|uniref:alpha-xylosidase n=1 Tax=Ruania halotolerans TaxID=2897773 RepID=UPI001E45FAAD|nr:alpha-xylosidase [Ruania halotolerans]UFU07667.1 alpha-xylosidase [Ruania halotolerans]
MKFTDGYWQTMPGVEILRPRAIESVVNSGDHLLVHASTAPLRHRGDTLNRPMITIRVDAPAEGVIGVRIEHFTGRREHGPRFALAGTDAGPQVDVPASGPATLTSGGLTARVATEGPWSLELVRTDGTVLTTATDRGTAFIATPEGPFVREQHALGIGEHLYGLGERFGPLVKNGQSVDIWNADGGTASEQAYKNVPFHLSDRGYGVFVDHPERVSYEIGTEVASRTQFSVPGQRLQYYVIDGPDPKDVLRRYTALTGRPARVPTWSYGLWLSTSFTTDYDEATVTSFIDGMAERDLPLSVFHFDCFWMRQFHWSDFVWDPATFPDPEGMLARLHERGLKVCVWVNPYIAQRSHLFAEAAEQGFLVTTPEGDVWQWDMWQAGMGLVDFTNPQAWEWFQDKLRVLLGQGVDAFKTDFGERIPTDVVWHDGSDPQRMHNYYAQLYNQCVFELLEAERGEGDAVLFARSATAGGQQFPVHWGGDCESTFTAMAESLRGGLSLAASGFGFWSHDIGGFEGTPEAAVFKRWVAFGLLSSHSRLHGSSSYRVPWAFDEEAVAVTRHFTHLKHRLMPYLARAGQIASTEGIPVMRPMVVDFPDDRSVTAADTQYMLGGDLLVAPVFDERQVEYYLPEGTWTQVPSGERVTGGRWVRETHGFDSVPLLARPGSVIAFGARTDRPDYPYADGVELHAFDLTEGAEVVVQVPTPDGGACAAEFTVRRLAGHLEATLVRGAAHDWALVHRGERHRADGPVLTVPIAD